MCSVLLYMYMRITVWKKLCAQNDLKLSHGFMLCSSYAINCMYMYNRSTDIEMDFGLYKTVAIIMYSKTLLKLTC